VIRCLPYWPERPSARERVSKCNQPWSLANTWCVSSRSSPWSGTSMSDVVYVDQSGMQPELNPGTANEQRIPHGNHCCFVLSG
jgi:hypothetical protein